MKLRATAAQASAASPLFFRARDALADALLLTAATHLRLGDAEEFRLTCARLAQDDLWPGGTRPFPLAHLERENEPEAGRPDPARPTRRLRHYFAWDLLHALQGR